MAGPTATMEQFKPFDYKGNYSATLNNNMKLVDWPLMGWLLHLVQRRGDWVGPQQSTQFVALDVEKHDLLGCTLFNWVS